MRELGRRPAVRAPGCRERRCWALRTGLAPPPPPLVANADAFLEPRQRQKQPGLGVPIRGAQPRLRGA